MFCFVGVLGLWLECRDVVVTLFPLRILSAPAGLPPTGTTLPLPKLLPIMLLLLLVLLLPLVPPPTLFNTGQASLLAVLSGTCWLGRPEPTTREVEEEEEEEEVEEVQPVESSDDSVVCWSKDCWGGDDCSTVTGDEDFFLKRKKK